ncbi:MAG: glycosyltransferase family 4 protein [Acidobacteriota bacterium]
MEQWGPLLLEQGVEITYAPFETDELRIVLHKNGQTVKKVMAVLKNMRRRWDSFAAVRDFDIVYIFREAALLGPAWFERKLARSGVPVVFDFDDAVFVAYKSPSNGYLSYLKFPGKTATICRLSAHIMAGNQYLADYALKYNSNVTIVPTTIDTDKYSFQVMAERDVVTIGWSGSFSTVQHLDTIRDVLRDLAKTEKFRLRVIGTPEYQIDGIETEALPWRSESEIADLRAIDIGLMPLPDEDWSRGKCGLKALQYMALGIPTICSPVGVNTSIIQDGENGFLAADKEEWITKLKELIRSVELRRRIGKAGHETVVKEYSAHSQAPRVLDVFKAALKENSVGKTVKDGADAGKGRINSENL